MGQVWRTRLLPDILLVNRSSIPLLIPRNGGGQILVCTAGEGWYQEEGKEAVSLVPGMVVTIPANVKHWHGAKAGSWFSHIAIEIPGTDGRTEWREPVADETYGKLEEMG